LNMECKDRNCPIHGMLSTRGTQLEGVVASDKMQGTVIVQINRMIKVKKYDRYKKSRSRIPAHSPPCLAAKTGDLVRIMECRKLAKTVSFVVIEKLGKGDAAAAQEPKVKAKAHAVEKAEDKEPAAEVKEEHAKKAPKKASAKKKKEAD
jgi:small subunit ribosomal protein S17